METDSLRLLADEAETLFETQLREWPFVAAGYEALQHLQERSFVVGGVPVRVQWNPARIRSTASKVDSRSVAGRPCFLCDAHRPVEQLSLPVGGRYKLLVNPYPIFPRHFTLPACDHTPQLLAGRFGDLLQLASAMPRYVVFYNGPRCGASAPDHMHFQAGNRGFVPIESQWEQLVKDQGESEQWGGGILYSWLTRWPAAMLVFEGEDFDAMQSFWHEIETLLPVPAGHPELPVNLLCAFSEGRWRCWAVLRTRHRPAQYGGEGAGSRLISPGAVDMAGVVITPRKQDFDALTPDEMSDILGQVAAPEWLHACLKHLKKTK